MIFLSLKTYKEATGQAVIKLLSSVSKVSKKQKVTIIPVAQPTDIYLIKKKLNIEVWAQHIDPIDPGRNFGFISAYAVKEAGATGVIINHSEHKLDKETIIKTIKKAREYDLKIMVIGQTPEMVLTYDSFDIDFIAYEKEDLIAGPVSMIDEKEEEIKKLVKKLKHPLIIGAGIQDGEDVRKTKKSGAYGVLLATSFIKASNHKKKLEELACGFK